MDGARLSAPSENKGKFAATVESTVENSGSTVPPLWRAREEKNREEKNRTWTVDETQAAQADSEEG
jgi:hypothetical protein